jgi:hypothetical protein
MRVPAAAAARFPIRWHGTSMRRHCARSAQWRGPQSARRFCLHPPQSSIWREPPYRGEAGRGLGETWNRGRDFPGPGAVPGFPQCDTKLVSLLQSVRSGAGVIPTSPSGPLGVGVRSGSRRRNGPDTSTQAGRGARPESHSAAPARAGAALCGGSADAIWVLTVTEIEIDPLESRAGPDDGPDRQGT